MPKIQINNVTVFENDGRVSIQVERSEGLHRSIVMDVATVDGTASGKECTNIMCNYNIILIHSWHRLCHSVTEDHFFIWPV